jgi:ABC-2 type transport system permease protein
MRPTLSLIKREFTAYFLSPIAYVVLAVFLLVTGHLFYLTLNLLTESGPRGVEFPMQSILGDEKFWLIFLFIPPLLTMRLFAEERGSGTLEMLMTAPVRDWQVVLAKFVACFLFYLVLWAPTIVYWPVLTDFQGVNFHPFRVATNIDPRPLGVSYLGVILAGAMFLSLGLFVSSLVRSQMVAALVSLLLSLLFIVAGFWHPEMDSSSLIYQIIFYISVPLHFSRDFTRGILNVGHLVLYVSMTLFFLFMTVRSLESRRWK